MHEPSVVQVKPLPHSDPPEVQTASHLLPEQWNPLGQLETAALGSQAV
jgi:hypothetical protein